MKNKTPDFAYHMTKFFTEYLPIQRNLSPNSIATYRDTFRLLLLFYDTEKHIKPNLLTLDMLNVQQIEDFMLWLKKERNCEQILYMFCIELLVLLPLERVVHFRFWNHEYE